MKITLTLLLTLGIFTGCGPRTPMPVVHIQPQPKVEEIKPIPKAPVAPKRDLKLKEIKDTNYSDQYMYPEDTKAAKKDPVVKTVTPKVVSTGAMTKEACISMISQEKFDKYTTMFGSEDASIKRCAMIQAMNK